MIFRSYQKFAENLPPNFGAFAKAYLETLSKMTGEEIKEKFGETALEKIKSVFPEKFMDEDFRAKNIGMPNTLGCSVEGKKMNAEFKRQQDERLSGRKRRPLFGARISEDFGKSWRLKCLCDDCIKTVEPPRKLKNEGAAGALKCDWCGALNNDQDKN